MFGYTRRELCTRQLRDLQGEDFLPTSHALNQFRNGLGEPSQQVGSYRRKDGSHFWGRLALSLASPQASEPAFLVAILQNTSKHKRVVEISREAEKMEIIGRLTGGIAHDFNNLLTGILLYCDLLSDGIERGHAMMRFVDEIRLAGEQGSAMTQQLLTMARKKIPQVRSIGLNEVVSTTVDLLRRLIGEQNQLRVRLAPALPAIRGDPAQLRQVLLNLVLNARDAMPQGGLITLRTRLHPAVGGTAAGVALVVEDSGCGMDEKTRRRIFEPFFTTKRAGQGTGLGLATVQRIVAESHGKIEVKSEPGHGTRFEVSLPVFEVAPVLPVPVKKTFAPATILLVDDHPSVRTSIQRVLQHAGFRVLAAASGKQALKVFARSSHEVELLLADWMMPVMSGRELAAQIRHLKPDLKILLISGYHDPHGELAGDTVELIRKPFAGSALLKRIREVLNYEGD
jgi:two-component system cell cycle sensor histidine kinase/response regulator CckA